MNALNNIVDYFNIMSYDGYINSNQPTMHHTAPRSNKLDYAGASVEATIEYFTDSGLTTRKLIGGCGLYTIGYTGLPSNTSAGIWVDKSTASSFPASGNYHFNQLDILTTELDFTRYWDSLAEAAWMYRESDSTFLTFDDSASIEVKCNVINETGACGLMIWELSCFQGTTILSSMDTWIN